MTLQANIKRLNDGSIDYAHYIARSQAMRRNDANQSFASICRTLKATWNATKLHMVFHRGSDQSQGARHPLAHAVQRSAFSRIGHL